MKTKSVRLLTTLAALLLSIIIVIALSFAGSKSRGPLENFFDRASNVVQEVENKVIIEQREHRRADDLVWFQLFKGNQELIKHPKKILLGAYDNRIAESFRSIIDLEDSLHTNFPLVHIYKAWGTKPEEQFPKQQVQAVLELGSSPVITWEPWLTDFDAEKYPNLRKVSERDLGGLAEVAKGVYDNYIRQWGTEARDIKQPIFLLVGTK